MPRRDDAGNGPTYRSDFSDDEIVRRANEVIRRCCGAPATFDLNTGQPFDGPSISAEELKRRGY